MAAGFVLTNTFYFPGDEPEQFEVASWFLADNIMPFRIIRVLKPPVKKGDVLQVAVATSRIAKELSNLSMFPPMAATVSVLLVILDTLKVTKDIYCIVYCFNYREQSVNVRLACFQSRARLDVLL